MSIDPGTFVINNINLVYRIAINCGININDEDTKQRLLEIALRAANDSLSKWEEGRGASRTTFFANLLARRVMTLHSYGIKRAQHEVLLEDIAATRSNNDEDHPYYGALLKQEEDEDTAYTSVPRNIEVMPVSTLFDELQMPPHRTYQKLLSK